MSALKKFRQKTKSADHLDDLLLKIRQIFLREYERGSNDVLTRLTGMIDTKARPEKGAVQHRAPRGAVRAFVEKALKSGPKSIKQIRETAKTDVEKIFSYQTVRLELERGKKDKRYKKDKSGWSILSTV